MCRKRGKAILYGHTCHNRSGQRPDNAISVMRTRMTNVTSNAHRFIVHDYIRVGTITAIILIRVSRVDIILEYRSSPRRVKIEFLFPRQYELYPKKMYLLQLLCEMFESMSAIILIQNSQNFYSFFVVLA